MADGSESIRPERLVIRDVTGSGMTPVPTPVSAEWRASKSAIRAHFATPTPVTLRTALALVGGYKGTIRSPATGTVHEVDLTAYEGADLDETLLMISIRRRDPAKVGTKRADYDL
jgi:hypothetical protein